jgi:hypothetical protein
LLVSAIFPPSTPSGITNRSIANEQVSPTYSISASSNRARLFEPMVLILGTHIIYPDLGALPYTTFEGDDQFLYQVLHFGLTDITLTDIKIGQTTTDQYSDVTTEFSTLDSGALTLFPVNTESTLGATLSNAASWITRTGGTNATGLRIEFSGSLFSTNTETGSTESFNLDLQAQYRISGSADPWLAFTGDVDGNFTITSSSRKAVRRSYFISVSSGQYEVRVRQTSSDTLPTNANSQMEWVQLLTMQPDTADYSDQLRMAIRIKASGQLNGNLDQLNAIASARIPVWNGVTEVIQASSNPGHQFIWLARGKTDGNGRRLYGAGLSDSQIDLDGLREWADWCGTNNLQCNLVFDTPTSVNDMLVTVARCGRASPSWASGKLGVIYDKKNLPIIQIFGMNNIKQGSFQVEYVTENLADEVVVTFINPSLDWKPDTVRVSVPGADNPKNSASVQILGITSSTQAAREANLLASRQYYHRRKITWQTDAEGFVCNRGDVVALAHNLTSWANSGRLVTGSTDAILYLDQDIIFTDDTPYITVRSPDNTIVTRQIVNGVGSTSTLTLSSVLPFDPSADSDNLIQDYIWFFESDSIPGKKVKITDINPIDENTISIEAIDEVDEFYDTEYGDFSYVTPTRYNGELANVSSITFDEDLLNITGLTNVHISWKLTQSFGARLLISIDDGSTVDYGIIYGTSYTLLANSRQRIAVTLTPQALVNLRSNIQPKVASYTVVGLDATPSDIEGFVVARNIDDLHFSWSSVSDIDLDHYRIKKGDSWTNAILIADVTDTFYRLSSAKAGTYLIKSVDVLGNESVTASAIIVGSTQDANFIVQHDEYSGGWAGTKNQTTVIDGNLQLDYNGSWTDLSDTWDSYMSPWGVYPAVYSSGTYVSTTIDLGVSVDSRIEVDMSVSINEYGINWADFGEIWSTYSGVWNEGSDKVSVTVEIDTSDDGAIWDGYRTYVPGYYNARYIRFRLTLATTDNIYQPSITQFDIDVDVPDRIVRFENQSILIAGTTLSFSPAFNAIPAVNVTIQAGAIGDNYKLSSKTISAVTINLYNSAGVAKAGTVDVVAIAY